MTRTDRRRIAVTTLVVLLVDGASKLWATAALADGPIDLGWISLRLAQNPGIAFSLGADSPWWVVTLLTAGATVAIAVMALRGQLHPPVAAGLLLGGGLGNLVDRLAGGTVTDFFALDWFPTFNVADVALNVGVALVLLLGLFPRDDEPTHDEVDDESVAGDPVADVDERSRSGSDRGEG